MNDIIMNAMADLEEDILFDEVKKAAENNEEPSEIFSALQKGLEIVGDRFQEGEYFLADLMLSGELFDEASSLIGGDEVLDTGEKKGTFLIGTVETDIHDIGKNIVTSVMKTNGFNVIDIGINVPVEKFVEEVRKYQPDIIGCSCLLTTCFDYMKKTIERIREEGLDKGRLILIGGGPVEDSTVAYCNADARCANAQEAVVVSSKFMEAR